MYYIIICVCIIVYVVCIISCMYCVYVLYNSMMLYVYKVYGLAPQGGSLTSVTYKLYVYKV
jgi:hypothetical protein